MIKTVPILGLFAILIASSISIGSITAQEEIICAKGEVVVSYTTNSNLICLNESTADRWERLGILEIVSTDTIAEEEVMMEAEEEVMEAEEEVMMEAEEEVMMEEEVMEEVAPRPLPRSPVLPHIELETVVQATPAYNRIVGYKL